MNENNLKMEENEELKLFKDEISNMDEIGKFSLIIDQLKNTNHNIRLFCVKQLRKLAELLGPSRIEDELIPLMIELIINSEDNEEVLTEFSNQLFSFYEYLPTKNKLSEILKGLEVLAANDDETVRGTATENLCKIIRDLDDNTIKSEIFTLMQRLIQNDMKSKISCCYIFPVVYQKINEDPIKKELIQAYLEISRDDSPSVRRSAALNIKTFSMINDEELIRDLINLHSDFLKDSIDIVKVHAIEATKSLIHKLPEENKKKLLTNFNIAINRDKSWRVKYAAAEAICDICSDFSEAFNEQNFLPTVMLFLKDPEPEVRSSMLSNIHNFIKYISQQKFLSHLLPIFNDNISSDSNHHVRSIYAISLMKLCKFSDEINFDKHLIPLITKITKDEVVEVRHAALENILEIQKFFHDENLMKNIVMPLLNEIAKDTKWRIRLTLVEKLCLINCLNYADYFLPMVNIFFCDHAYQIRENTYKIYEKLCEERRDLINTIWDIQAKTLNSLNYILRISALKSIEYLKRFYANEFLIDTVFPCLFSLKSDKVANVKFSLCNLIKSLFGYLKENRDRRLGIFSNELNQAIQILESMDSEESDIDVRYFARETLKCINS